MAASFGRSRDILYEAPAMLEIEWTRRSLEGLGKLGCVMFFPYLQSEINSSTCFIRLSGNSQQVQC